MQIDTNIYPKKQWTEDEIDQLRYLYSSQGLSAKEIAPTLKRTKVSVWVKIKRLKIRHTSAQTTRIKHDNMCGNNNPMHGKKSWCKGETKESNPVLQKSAVNMSITRTKLFAEGVLKGQKGKDNPMFGVPSWNKGLNTGTSPILRIAGRKNSMSKKQRWLQLPEEEKQKIRKHCAIMGAKCKKQRTSIEIKIDNLLYSKRNIVYYANHYLDGFVFDFYLPSLNLVIECQGDYWHGNPRKYSDSNLNKIQQNNIKRDNRKKEYLSSNHIGSLFLWEYDIKKNFEAIREQIESHTNLIEKA